MQSATKERLEVLIKMEDDTDEIVNDCDTNSILVVKGLGKEVAVSQRPDDWTPKAPNKAAGEPELAAIDNPGEWDMYTYRPRFCSKAKKDFKKGQYTHHALPTGARPVPADDTGSRQKAGWEFHYKKWTNEDGPKFRSGATRTNPSLIVGRAILIMISLRRWVLPRIGY